MTIRVNVRDIRKPWVNFVDEVVKGHADDNWVERVQAVLEEKYTGNVLFRTGVPNLIEFNDESKYILFMLEHS